MAHELKNGKNYSSGAEVVNLHPAMRAFTDSFIVSNPGLNYTVSELHYCITYSVNNRFLSTWEKGLSQPRKAGILASWCHTSMGEFFRLLWQNVNAARKVLQNSPKNKRRSFGDRKY